jgi:hypothetical protein
VTVVVVKGWVDRSAIQAISARAVVGKHVTRRATRLAVNWRAGQIIILGYSRRGFDDIVASAVAQLVGFSISQIS